MLGLGRLDPFTKQDIIHCLAFCVEKTIAKLWNEAAKRTGCLDAGCDKVKALGRALPCARSNVR